MGNRSVTVDGISRCTCQCEDCLIVRQAIQADREAEIELAYKRKLIDALHVAADIIVEYPRLWKFGNGNGGWVAMELRTALEDRDFVTSQSFDVWSPRREVLRLAERDGWDCTYCGVTLDGCPDRPKPHIDHVIPKSRGGTNSKNNKVLACPKCNTSKGARTPQEWRADEQFLQSLRDRGIHV